MMRRDPRSIRKSFTSLKRRKSRTACISENTAMPVYVSAPKGMMETKSRKNAPLRYRRTILPWFRIQIEPWDFGSCTCRKNCSSMSKKNTTLMAWLMRKRTEMGGGPLLGFENATSAGGTSAV